MVEVSIIRESDITEKELNKNREKAEKHIEPEGCITEIQKFSVHDGPGIRTLVFLKGCPLNCLWCQNPETKCPDSEMRYDAGKCIGCNVCIEECPQKAISLKGKKLLTDKKLCNVCGKCAEKCYAGAREIVGKMYSVSEVFDVVAKDKVFYKNSGGGITLSGGEPLLQWQFSTALLKKCKENNINTAVETCGFAKWENFEKVLKFTDFLLYDIKVIDPGIHKEYTGQSNELIISNLKKASKVNSKIIIRFPLIPNVNDDEDNLKATAKLAKKVSAIELHLLPYHEVGISKYKTLDIKYLLKNTAIPSNEEVNRVKAILEKEGVEVIIGGSSKKINLA